MVLKESWSQASLSAVAHTTNSAQPQTPRDSTARFRCGSVSDDDAANRNQTANDVIWSLRYTLLSKTLKKHQDSWPAGRNPIQLCPWCKCELWEAHQIEKASVKSTSREDNVRYATSKVKVRLCWRRHSPVTSKDHLLDQAGVFLARFLCYRGFQLYVGSAMQASLRVCRFSLTRYILQLRKLRISYAKSA
jgi:hypothetical protein